MSSLLLNYILVDEKFIPLSTGKYKDNSVVPKLETLPKSGKYLICHQYYKSFKKHHSSCLSKFNKLKSDILLFGVDKVNPTKKKIHRPSKICEAYHKKCIFKHKNPKIS